MHKKLRVYLTGRVNCRKVEACSNATKRPEEQTLEPTGHSNELELVLIR